MSLFDDSLVGQTLTGIRTMIVGYAQGAGLIITNWLTGAVGDQIMESVTQTVQAATQIGARTIRGFASLDTSTDPGDEDAYDSSNAGLTPERGFLSNYGENVYGTVRAEATFASGFVTFVNGGSSPRSFAPESLVFTWEENDPPDPAPTYRNSADAAIYTNPDGTVTVAPNASLVIPVTAEEEGSRSSAPSANSLAMTTTIVGCTATNAAAILATDREDADLYRTRCRQAAARLSFSGPAEAIAYLATKNLDGTPLLNEDGNPVNINRVFVSNDSDTGIVDVFLASPSGEVSDDADLEAADDNIQETSYAVTDCATVTVGSAEETVISMAGNASVPSGSGVTILAVREAIVAALAADFADPDDFPIGGKDQDEDGAGVIYTNDLRTLVALAYPGLYNVNITTPAGAETAIPRGHVPVLSTSIINWAITIV